MKIVTAAEMREIDRATSERFGVHSLTLMENAGASVADFVLSHYSSARRIVVICGRGNNGGGGFLGARALNKRGKNHLGLPLPPPPDPPAPTRGMFSQIPVPLIGPPSTAEWRTQTAQHHLHL